MGLNADALANYKPRGVSGAREWFRPKPGENGELRRFNVRLLLKPGDETPFYNANIHYYRYGGNFNSGACPRHKGEACPSCDMFFALRLLPQFVGDSPQAKTNKENLRNLGPQTRVYANVLNRDEGRIQVWSMPFGLFEDLKSNLLTYLEDGIDLTDPENGRDLVLSVSKKGAVTKYGSISTRPKESKLGLDDGWEAQLFNLEEKALQRQFSGDEVEDHVEGALGEYYVTYVDLFENATKLTETSKPAKADDELGKKV